MPQLYIFQFWRHDNHPIELWSKEVIDEKIDYVYINQLEAGLVFSAEDYLYSSAPDYANATLYNRAGAGVIHIFGFRKIVRARITNPRQRRVFIFKYLYPKRSK